MKAWARAAVFAAIAPCAFACNDGACVTRGSATTYEGTATWTGASSGSALALIQVDDLDTTASCDEVFVEFTVRVDTCLLWVVMTSSGKRDVASVEPNQTCTFPLGGDSVTLTTDAAGSLRVGTNVRLTVSGTVSGPSPGSLQWTFQE